MRRLVQRPKSFTNAFISGAIPVARLLAIPMLVFAVLSSRYAIRPFEPFFVLGGFFVVGVLLGGLCCTTPLIWQGIVHRWFSQR